MAKSLDGIIRQKHRNVCPKCQHILKLFRGFKTFGFIQNGTYALIIPNKNYPCRSTIIVEKTKNVLDK